jgi:hypothetical protein
VIGPQSIYRQQEAKRLTFSHDLYQHHEALPFFEISRKRRRAEDFGLENFSAVERGDLGLLRPAADPVRLTEAVSQAAARASA